MPMPDKWNYQIVEVDGTVGLYEVFYNEDNEPEYRTLEPVVFAGYAKAENIIHELKVAVRDARGYPVLSDSCFSSPPKATD